MTITAKAESKVATITRPLPLTTHVPDPFKYDLRYLAIGNSADAATTFIILGGSLVLQALSAWSTGEGPVATLVALSGGKTMLDTYNVANDVVPTSGVDPLQSLTRTRMYVGQPPVKLLR